MCVHFVVVPLPSCVQLCDPMDCIAHQASLFLTVSWSFPKFMSIELVMPSNHLILSYRLLLLPSIFLSIRVFSNELPVHIRWLKFWSFSFSISPSSEHSGCVCMCTYICLFRFPSIMLLQNIEWSSLCYPVSPCLSVLYIIVYIYSFQPPSLSLFPFPLVTINLLFMSVSLFLFCK